MRQVEIPGGVAHLREQHEVRTRHKQLVEAASVAAASGLRKLYGRSQEDLESLDMGELHLDLRESMAMIDLQNATIIALLSSWTLGIPVPDMDTIGDLDPAVTEALVDATREDGAALALGVDFSPPDPKSPEMEGSPTEPSAGSDSGLRADTESKSTELPSSDGTSSPSVEPSRGSATTTT